MYDLSQTHKKLYKVLYEFDSLCKKNGILYTLHGGTLLGAVRYSDFIPWDDDLDIAMRRSDYELLLKTIENNEQFYVKFNNTWTPRLFTKYDNENGIDIFIFDYISEQKFCSNLKILLIKFLQGTFRKKNNYKKYNLIHWPLLFVTWLIGLPFSNNLKVEVYNWVCRTVFQGNKKWIHRANDSYKGVSEIFQKEVMESYTTLKIKNTDFKCAREYETFLIISYGTDYLTPPPEQERVPIHR